MKKYELHDLAIRLVEGGQIVVDNHRVKLGHAPYIFDPCFCCDMECLCHEGNNMCNVCEECDSLLREDCFLILVTTD